VDPLTLLALANSAVLAVKKGCQLYKDIKGAAGDVKEVLDDLKTQFHKIPNPSNAQVVQYNQEVARIQEIAKADPNDVFTDIGNQLGALLDAQDQLGKALLAEEIQIKPAYKGEESVGRRALRKIIIEARVDSMMSELREMMVYQAPQELGSLWHKYEKTVEKIVAKQEIAHAEELRLANIAKCQRENIRRRIKKQMTSVVAVLFIILWFLWVMIMIRTSHTYRGLYSSPFWSCVLC
jgi:hypothetical protein